MKHLFLFSFFIMGLFFSACSQDPEFFNAASGTLDQATATSNKSNMEASAKIPTNGTPSGTPSLTRDLSSCTSKDPATPVDADSDNVKTQTVVFDCKGVPDTEEHDTRGGVSTRTGKYTITDTDDNDANSGYKYTYDVEGSYKNGTTHDLTYDYNGFWELVKNATTLSYGSKYRGKYGGTEGGVKQDGVSGGQFSFTITPTDMASVWTGGTAEMSGFFAYNWDNKNYVFKTAGTGLKYLASCGNFYTEGTFSYTDGANNVVTFNWGDATCDAPTVKYNETTL